MSLSPCYTRKHVEACAKRWPTTPVDLAWIVRESPTSDADVVWLALAALQRDRPKVCERIVRPIVLRSSRVHAAKACAGAGLHGHAKALRAIKSTASYAEIERVCTAAWAAAMDAECKRQRAEILRAIAPRRSRRLRGRAKQRWTRRARRKAAGEGNRTAGAGAACAARREVTTQAPVCRGASGETLCTECDVCKNCHPGQCHSYNLTIERQDEERKRQRKGKVKVKHARG
jgi:hypothetical protein